MKSQLFCHYYPKYEHKLNNCSLLKIAIKFSLQDGFVCSHTFYWARASRLFVYNELWICSDINDEIEISEQNSAKLEQLNRVGYVSLQGILARTLSN